MRVPTRGTSEPAEEAVCACVSRSLAKNVRRSAAICFGFIWSRVEALVIASHDSKMLSFEAVADSFLCTKAEASAFRSALCPARRRRRNQMQNKSRAIMMTTQPPDAAPAIIPTCDVLELPEGDDMAVAEELGSATVPPGEDDAGAAEPESDARDRMPEGLGAVEDVPD
jgi:hypothetical protein